ncbi:hypothetical protein KP509_35G036200 [Ceratopteris richardii]|uniref:Uncharacterized protein n=1 Tax=Ceratopteris richardii TaxID=49495 RepID=A0A8T2QH88_CERRI|nr:hypothetical protein KP509_35G036200 [Ceratopteris richardii]
MPISHAPDSRVPTTAFIHRLLRTLPLESTVSSKNSVHLFVELLYYDATSTISVFRKRIVDIRCERLAGGSGSIEQRHGRKNSSSSATSRSAKLCISSARTKFELNGWLREEMSRPLHCLSVISYSNFQHRS